MHLPPKATLLVGGALNAGCSVLGGLTIFYGNQMDWEYDEFTGTALQVSPNTFHIKDAAGRLSPSFSAAMIAGQTRTVYFLKPTYYIVPPFHAPGSIAGWLGIALASMGGALIVLSMFQKDQGKVGNVLRTSGILFLVLGLINSLVMINDGLQYIPVTGTAEDAGNNRFRVRFPEGHVSPDMDIPAGSIPTRFGSAFTLYRTDQAMVRFESIAPWHFFLMAFSAFVIIIGVIGLFGVVRTIHNSSRMQQIDRSPQIAFQFDPIPIPYNRPQSPVYGIPLSQEDVPLPRLPVDGMPLPRFPQMPMDGIPFPNS